MQMDIVERCNRIASGSHPDLADIVCADAAAEIERLREPLRLLLAVKDADLDAVDGNTLEAAERDAWAKARAAITPST